MRLKLKFGAIREAVRGVIIFGVIFLIDVISMIVYVSLYGFPQ